MDHPPLVVHYHRTDNLYDEAGLWVWNAADARRPHAREIFSDEADAFGRVFRVDAAAIAGAGKDARLGIIPRIRRSWDFKDGHDRVWTPDMGREIWIVQDDRRLHRQRPVVRPRIRHALLDAPDCIRLILSHTASREALAPERIRLAGPSGPFPTVARVESLEGAGPCGGCRLWRLDLSASIVRPDVGFEVHLEGFEPAPLLLGQILYTHPDYHSELPMGCTLEAAGGATFRLFAPNARKASLVLWDGRDDVEPAEEHDLSRGRGGVWSIHLGGALEGRYYGFRTDTPPHGDSGAFADPMATNTVGLMDRSRITDLHAHDPEGFRPIERPALPSHLGEAVIYELSVRDFTIDASSGARHRGKFLGLAEFGTHLPDDHSVATGIDHLKELGVTHVQLLPIQDFDNDEDNPAYNWGYMTAFFNSPEGWHATDHRGPARVAEFKELVQALHEAGIGVILDVVYNHTGVQSTLETAAPGYYHRLRPNHSFWNGSGTGNELDSEAPMARRLIVDSCMFWVQEYGVDGFRFDLMGLVDLETMKEVREKLHAVEPRLLVYGEPWTGGESGLRHITGKHSVAGTGIGAFNDDYRNALKGEPEGPWAGYIHNGSRADEMRAGIAGSVDVWSHSPVDSVNYADCHDNLTLWDKTALCSREPEADRARMQALAIAVMAVSQGAMFLHAGVEFCRTKGGHPNSYDAGDAVNAIRWGLKKQHRWLFEHARAMIAIRRAHPLFHLASEHAVRQRLRFRDDLAPRADCIAFALDGEGLAGEHWRRAFVAINPLGDALEFRLPEQAPGEIHALDDKASVAPIGAAKGSIFVPRWSLALVAWPKA